MAQTRTGQTAGYLSRIRIRSTPTLPLPLKKRRDQPTPCHALIRIWIRVTKNCLRRIVNRLNPKLSKLGPLEADAAILGWLLDSI